MSDDPIQPMSTDEPTDQDPTGGWLAPNTRAKFQCYNIEELQGTRWSPDGVMDTGVMYKVQLRAVVDGSAENKHFFASTPGGELYMVCVRDPLFKVGENYYMDFTPAP